MLNLNNKDKDKLGILIMVVVVIIFISLFVYLSILKSRQLSVAENFCPTEQKHPHTVVLIDDTDTLSLGQIATSKRYMNSIKGELGATEKLSLYMIYESAQGNLVPLFSLCNPRKSEKKCNPFIKNCEQTKREYETSFGNVLDETLNKLYDIGENPNSPIMEVIQKISTLEDYGSGYDAQTRLIIFSDMLQNTPRYSHYNSTAFEQCSESSYCQKAIPNLRNTEVIIYYIQRPRLQAIQDREHIYFWEQYFRAGGARVTKVSNILQ